MSVAVQKLFVICGSLLLVCVAQGALLAQTNVGGVDLLRPPKPSLVPVHFPDLKELESEVREQIKSQQNALSEAVKNVAASDADLSESYGVTGKTYHAYSLNVPARECYVNANRLAPKDFRWIYLLAKLDQQTGDAAEAIRRFQTAASLQPQFVAVPLNLGNIYLEFNRLEEAKASFAKALEIQKGSAAAYYGLGQVALSQRAYAEAVEYFQKALTLAPGANRIHYSLAMAYRGLGDAESAKLHLAQQGTVGVRVADPLVDGLQELVQGARVHLIRGKLAFEAKRYAEAATEFRRAVASNPASVPAHVNLGAALTQTGDLKEAIEEFEATLRIDPQNPTAHYNLAVLLARENKTEQAIVHLEAVSHINPGDFAAGLLLVQELLKLDRCAEAAEWQRKIIEAAIKQGRDDLLAKFRADLERYENVRPCRPPQAP